MVHGTYLPEIIQLLIVAQKFSVHYLIAKSINMMKFCAYKLLSTRAWLKIKFFCDSFIQWLLSIIFYCITNIPILHGFGLSNINGWPFGITLRPFVWQCITFFFIDLHSFMKGLTPQNLGPQIGTPTIFFYRPPACKKILRQFWGTKNGLFIILNSMIIFKKTLWLAAGEIFWKLN